MKRTYVVASVLVIAITAFGYEWRYSEDMQEHISSVNRDLESARLEENYASGLTGSIRAMTAATEVANEIMRTHDHVHTLKDEVLAWKIKKAVEQGGTVGGAIRMVIAQWPESL